MTHSYQNRLTMIVLLALSLQPALFYADEEPVVVMSSVGTADAREVEVTVHGDGGQNLSLRWGISAGGSGADTDAYYMFVSSASFRDLAAEMVPFMLQLDVASGKLRTFIPKQKIRLQRRKVEKLMDMDELDMDAGEDAVTVSQLHWAWGLPICGKAASDGSLYLGVARNAEAGGHTDAAILKYVPEKDVFEYVMDLPTRPIGIDIVGDQLMVLLQNTSILGTVAISLDGETSEHIGRLEGKDAVASSARMAQDATGHHYVALGGETVRLYSFHLEGSSFRKTRLLSDVPLRRVRFHTVDGVLTCHAVLSTEDGQETHGFRLASGVAEAMDATALPTPEEIEVNGVRIASRFDQLPPAVQLTDTAGETRSIPIRFPGVAYDRIKVLMADPGGRYIYGSGWPVANVWRYEPATGVMHKYANHYVFYEMRPWKGEIWACGYWGIKLLRWKPDEPWTFDYNKHYYEKSFPGNSSPWGDKGSNPRLVAKMRYLKKLHVRRPGGMVIGGDGRVYVGGRTPAVNTLDSRFGGAISWYDPATETIGAVREPFIHHSVRDVCRAGNRYVAAVASQYVSPYEPKPEDFSPGKFVLYDTQERQVALDSSPIGAALSYVEEGEPERVVGYGRWGKYGTGKHPGVFFIFDVKEMRLTHIIRSPLHVGWSEYNVLPFQRGPDNKIYFYGRDDDGRALCRIDSITGEIEAVVRGNQITNVAVINNPGAAFAFMGDRVYFGCHRLVSIPLTEVISLEDAAP